MHLRGDPRGRVCAAGVRVRFRVEVVRSGVIHGTQSVACRGMGGGVSGRHHRCVPDHTCTLRHGLPCSLSSVSGVYGRSCGLTNLNAVRREAYGDLQPEHPTSMLLHAWPMVAE